MIPSWAIGDGCSDAPKTESLTRSLTSTVGSAVTLTVAGESTLSVTVSVLSSRSKPAAGEYVSDFRKGIHVTLGASVRAPR